MKILHYSLGFPPYRTGGLTKFCIDLMKQQISEGNEVALLWPGQMCINDKVRIINRGKKNNIQSWEILNPLPVPLDEGIRDKEAFTKKTDIEVYKTFLQKTQPNTIHIHTLMGMHSEFIDAAKELKIKTIFSTHDYFGLCSKVTFYNSDSNCVDDIECKRCVECNEAALSINKIKILQSPIYRKLKDSYIVKKIRSNHRTKFFNLQNDYLKQNYDIEQSAKKYCALRKYYIDILEKIDVIHFNSTVAEKIYRKYIVPQNSKVISITHKDIKDNRILKENNDNKIRILFLAPTKAYKGFDILKTALDELWREGINNFELKIFNSSLVQAPYLEASKKGYQYSDLEELFKMIDILIAPSIWHETFGFTVLEAISHGVPVIISDRVGAKDIVPNGGGIVLKDISKDEIKKTIKELTKERIIEMNRIIVNKATIKTINILSEEIMKECYLN